MGKIDRIGEKGINNFGSEMVITEYRKWNDIDVYFPQYDWVARNRRYENFKRGEIKCPYEKRVFGMGCIGEGKYKTGKNGRHTRCYNTWVCMLERCYNEEHRDRNPTYINCEASEEFLNFQKFGEWDSENYYEIGNEKMHLDKDILCKGNKIYSPDTCIYVPQTINSLFTKNDKARGDSPIGSTPCENGKYQVRCRVYNFETGKSKKEYLGYYETQEKAFKVYKEFKERYIKEIADYYKKQIPKVLYDALYNYEVEITD